jgi:DNA-binding NarL/FixJ family response regulator
MRVHKGQRACCRPRRLTGAAAGGTRHGAASPPAQAWSATICACVIQILHALAQGYTTSDIARLLFLSYPTVSRQIASIVRKLGVQSRVEAVVWALRHGLVNT